MCKNYLEELEYRELKDQLELFYPNLKDKDNYKNDFFFNEYKKLDSVFNTKYDISYQNLVNFSCTKNLPFHRWFYYQEGYSPELVKKVIKYLNLTGKYILFDPFAGSGTSLVVAKEIGLDAIGVEINPLSCHIANSKTQRYSEEEINILENFELPNYVELKNGYEKYEFSMIKKLFEEENFNRIELIKEKISLENNIIAKNALLTALLSILQQVSFYKKSGNGLKKGSSNIQFERGLK